MGVSVSSELKEQQIRSKALEKELSTVIRKAGAIKLLLLGPGGSGKSTILKQMMILHAGGFSKEEIEKRKIIIRNNVIGCMSALLSAMKTFDISFGPQLQLVLGHIDLDKILGHKDASNQDEIFPTLHDALSRLWKDPGIQKCYKRRNEFNLEDSAKYFLDNLDRICSASYQPTNQDILRSRANTSGVQEISFEARPHKTMFRVFDAGGQRSERRKWIHHFDAVDSVIFIAGLSDYCATLREETARVCWPLPVPENAMDETLDVFESVLSSQWFNKKPMILFLNKKDLFEENLRQFPLKEPFPDYEGGENYKKGIKFMTEVFKKRNRESSRMLYIHTTCATDTDQVQKVIDSVLNLITGLNAQKSGME